MNPSPIQRFSSRTHRLDRTVLLQYLQQARRYHRIAGYFTSSLFEIAAEQLDTIDEVKILCNSDVRSEDVKVAKIHESKLLSRFNQRPIEGETLLHRPRYQWLYQFLTNHPQAIRVAPDNYCGFVHGKAGVIELRDGRRFGFIGSMNETRAGWQEHYEIVWVDESPEGVDWIQTEFDALWQKAVPLPRVIVQEVGRRAHRVEIQIESEDIPPPDLAPAALVESPMYREGLSLQPWQRAFVTECLKHRQWHGTVRLLIADEVGLGKTLSLGTAALALTLLHEQELSQNRGRRKPIVILAPATLTEQWQTELLDKLGISCARWLSAKKVWIDPAGRPISPSGPEYIERCPLRIGIISTGLIIQPTREREILSQMSFEILILDESHKARSRQGMGKGQREPNTLLQFMVDAANRSHHVLLGTATPIQTAIADLWDQLGILHQGEGAFVLGSDFSPWHHPDRVLPVVIGQERLADPEQAWPFLRSPIPPVQSSEEHNFRRVLHEIRAELNLKERTFHTPAALVDLPPAVRDDLEDLLTSPRSAMTFFQRHNPIVRHVILRKRKVLEEAGLLPQVGVDLHPNADKSRDPQTFTLLFQRRALRTDQAFDRAYLAADDFGKAYRRRVKGAAGFMKNLLEQRLCSSCVAGLNTARALLTQQTLPEDPELEFTPDIEISEAEQETLQVLIAALESMQGEDPKLKAVKHYLSQENWLQHGCIVFSQYYDTARWVAENLAAHFPDHLVGLYAGAGKSALFRGPTDQSSAERSTLKQMVEDQAIRIMVATDAACEGLNLQRLGTLINVDLPWNPTRLEQRIGRIKRFGQTRPLVDMLNLVYQDTVDETIYERLSERMKDRFDLFGSLPDTIEDDWIEDIEKLDEKLDEYITVRKRMNGFDIRYNANLEAEEDEWRNCAKVFSRRSIETLMGQGW